MQITLKVYAPATAPEFSQKFETMTEAQTALETILAKYSPAPVLQSYDEGGAARYYYQSHKGRLNYDAASNQYRTDDGTPAMVRYIEIF